MSVPGKRIQIVKLIKDRLKEIRRSNYYMTDIGNNVYEWRVVPFSQEELPAINIRDTDAIANEVVSVSYYGLTNWKMTLMVDVVASGDDAVNQLRNACYDVYKCLGKDITLNDVAIDIRIVKDSIDSVIQESKRVAMATIELEVLFRTQTWGDN